jgi:ABC-type Fe3+-citrate transport system substrate-binding protein
MTRKLAKLLAKSDEAEARLAESLTGLNDALIYLKQVEEALPNGSALKLLLSHSRENYTPAVIRDLILVSATALALVKEEAARTIEKKAAPAKAVPRQPRQANKPTKKGVNP